MLKFIIVTYQFGNDKKHAQVTRSSKSRQISYMSVLMDENIWKYSSGLCIYHFKLDAVVVLFHSTRIRYFDRLFNWHESVWWKCVRKSTTGCNNGRIMTKQCWKACSTCPVQYILTGQVVALFYDDNLHTHLTITNILKFCIINAWDFLQNRKRLFSCFHHAI